MSAPENTADLWTVVRDVLKANVLLIREDGTAPLLTEALDALAALQAAHDQSERLRKRYFDESVQAQNDLERAEAECDRAEAAVQQMRQALELAQDALERHERWCGFNADAPGDLIVNVAKDALRAALAGVENPA